MTTQVSQAVQAYNQALRRADQPGVAGNDQVDSGSSFAAMVRRVSSEAIETGQRAEVLSAQGVVGQADLNDVVLAVNSAEVTLQTVVALRDRMIQSYQDIIRMPI